MLFYLLCLVHRMKWNHSVDRTTVERVLRRDLLMRALIILISLNHAIILEGTMHSHGTCDFQRNHLANENVWDLIITNMRVMVEVERRRTNKESNNKKKEKCSETEYHLDQIDDYNSLACNMFPFKSKNCLLFKPKNCLPSLDCLQTKIIYSTHTMNRRYMLFC